MFLKLISIVGYISIGFLNNSIANLYIDFSNSVFEHELITVDTKRYSKFSFTGDYSLIGNIYSNRLTIEELYLIEESNFEITDQIELINTSITYRQLILNVYSVNSYIEITSDYTFTFHYDLELNFTIYYDLRLLPNQTKYIQQTISGSQDFELQEEVPIDFNNILINQNLGFTFLADISDSQDYQEGYNDGYEEGYIEGTNDGEADGYNRGKEEGYNEGFNEGYNEGYNEGLINGDTEDSIFTFLNGVFRAVDAFLSVEIIPGITLWAVVLIPIVFGVIAFFLNLWR